MTATERALTLADVPSLVDEARAAMGLMTYLTPEEDAVRVARDSIITEATNRKYEAAQAITVYPEYPPEYVALRARWQELSALRQAVHRLQDALRLLSQTGLGKYGDDSVSYGMRLQREAALVSRQVVPLPPELVDELERLERRVAANDRPNTRVWLARQAAATEERRQQVAAGKQAYDEVVSTPEAQAVLDRWSDVEAALKDRRAARLAEIRERLQRALTGEP